MNMKRGALILVVLLKGCSPSAGEQLVEKPKSLDKGAAKILLLDGEVRVKRAFTSSWRQLTRETSLRKGDQVFTGPTGSVHIEYFGKAASISFGPYTHFTVNENPPSFTTYRRSFGAEGGKGADKGGNKGGIGASSKTIALQKEGRPVGQKQQPAEAVGSAGISMMRDTDLIPILFPQGRVLLQAKRFPASLAIGLEASLSQTPMWGFLWKKDDEDTPVWSGFSLGSFAAVPIPYAGSFILQIVSDDESKTSKPIYINAELRKTLALPVVDAKFSVQDPVSVVIQ
jgi:hypothetical protein